MSHELFEITIAGHHAEARYIDHDEIRQEFGPAELSGDALRMEAAELLEDWLNNWDQLDIDNRNQGLSKRTLTMIGKLLWHLILDNEVGDGLVDIIGPAAQRRDDRRLRVLVSFGTDVNPALAGLPWEFLYASEGYFLAAASDLILTRYVNGVARPEFKPTRETLRILFVAALPHGGEFDATRYRMIALSEALGKTRPVEVTTFHGRWDSEERDRKFEVEKPFHVIHVVGVCRGTAERPLMYLPTGAIHDWVDPKPLVDLLTKGGQERMPKLVVLELCGRANGDPTENFERLAPSLIRKGIPAVVAMQYPLPGEESQTNFAEMLYDELLSGEAVGEAVQKSRAKVAKQPQTRLFGTPVLYLQEDGVLVEKAATETSGGMPATLPSGTQPADASRADGSPALLRVRADGSASATGRVPPSAAPRGAWIRDKIHVAATNLDPQSAADVNRLLDGIDWSAPATKLSSDLQYVIRMSQDKAQLVPVLEEVAKELTQAKARRRQR